jgi:hypothetical protein
MSSYLGPVGSWYSRDVRLFEIGDFAPAPKVKRTISASDSDDLSDDAMMMFYHSIITEKA